MRRTGLFIGVAAVMALAVGAVVTGGVAVRDRLPAARRVSERMRTAPLALVLEGGTRSRLHIIDLERGRVLRVLRLRSFASDIAVSGRRAVTAQAGGVGSDADNACALIDLSEGAGVEYIKLPAPNPDDVEVVGDTALVVHGFEQSEGLIAHSLDVKTGRVLESGHLPSGIGKMRRVGDRLMAPVTSAGGEAASTSLVCIDPRAIEASEVLRDTLAWFTPLESAHEDSATMLVGYAGARGGLRATSSQAWESVGSKVASRTSLSRVRYGAEDACRVGTRLAVLDADSAMAPGAPAQVVLYDDALQPESTVRLGGTPVAECAGGRSLLTVDGDGVVQVIDPESGKTVKRIMLDLDRPVTLQVVAVGL